MVFVAENNGYGEATPFEYASACDSIADRAAAYNMHGVTVDGKDILAVYRAAEEAIERARNGGGPSLIECMTYRNYGHFEGDAQTYKTKDERAEHLEEKDAIQGFKNYLLKETDANRLSDIEQRVSKSIEKAVSFSEDSPYPKESDLLTDVYVSYEKGGM